MHSYQHNIKTFNSATMHLTRVERSVYRDLCEMYYDTEMPIPAHNFAQLARRMMCNTQEEKCALEYVLSEFFVQTGDVYTHDFIDEQIEAYHDSKTVKSRAGKASAEARKKKAEERKAERIAKSEQKLTGVEQVLNPVDTKHQHKPTNHKPETNNKKINKKDFAHEFAQRFAQFWEIYPNRKNRARAEKTFASLKISDDTLAVIKKNISDRISAGEWRLSEPEYIPHPTTYLNNRRWEDEITPKRQAPVNGQVREAIR